MATNEQAQSRSVIEKPVANGASPQLPTTQLDFLLLNVAGVADDIEPWYGRPAVRDRQLRDFWPTESHFASGVGSVCARNTAFSWTLEGGPRVVRQMQDVLENANDGKGWQDLIAKTSADLYTQDNGAFWEVVRSGDSESAPLIGLNHLDAARCYHTGDPRAPVIYIDVKGRYHLLKWYEVVTFTELPSPVETMYGRQMCALSRMLRAAQIIRNIMIYQQEKTGGRFNKAIHIIKGITTTQLQDAIASAALQMDQKGLIRYTTVPMVGIPEPEGDLKIATLELASLPDNFSQEDMLKWYITVMAMALLSDYQDFAPLPGGGLGTGTQSEVLHMKGSLKGPALFRKMITHALNRQILPKTVEFQYDEQDIEAEVRTAEARKFQAEGLEVLARVAQLPPAQVRQIALDVGLLEQHIFDALGDPDATDLDKIEEAENPDVPEESAIVVEAESPKPKPVPSPEVEPEPVPAGAKGVSGDYAGPF